MERKSENPRGMDGWMDREKSENRQRKGQGWETQGRVKKEEGGHADRKVPGVISYLSQTEVMV